MQDIDPKAATPRPLPDRVYSRLLRLGIDLRLNGTMVHDLKKMGSEEAMMEHLDDVQAANRPRGRMPY